MLEIIVVVRFAHRREIHHFRQALLQFVGVTVQCCECDIPRFDQFFVLVWGKIDIERHQTLVQERIDCAPRLDGELRVKLYRILQITQTLLEQRRHLP